MRVMIKSDGNGAYIVDRKLWGLVMALIVALFGLVAWGAQNTVGAVSDNSNTILANTRIIERNSAKIGLLERQLDRIETKLDKALTK